MNWTDIKVGAMAGANPVAGSIPAASTIAPTNYTAADQLMDAAGRFSARGQSKNAATCEDIAAKLRRFGSFASEAQQAYANKLLIWSKEEPRKSVFGVEQTRSEGVQVPTLWEFMQTTGELFLGDVKLARERADTLVWVMLNGTCVGKIVACVATLFQKRMSPSESSAIEALLLHLESNPAEIIRAIGREYGACCLCGQELSNPESIAAGIGPICAGRL